MPIIDLSHAISPSMPAYPGTKPPKFTAACTIESYGFAEKHMSMSSHTGTHLDAPAHVIAGAKTLDQMAMDRFIGFACVLDLSSIRKQDLKITDLEGSQKLIEASEFVLLHTGWSLFWGQEAYYQGYPVLSTEAAHWLSEFAIKGIGIDAISIDEMGSTELTIHRRFLEREIVIVENLTNLERLPKRGFVFSCFPLKIEHADGSPVRAIGIMDSLYSM